MDSFFFLGWRMVDLVDCDGEVVGGNDLTVYVDELSHLVFHGESG
jgi:hypothetical protein